MDHIKFEYLSREAHLGTDIWLFILLSEIKVHGVTYLSAIIPESAKGKP